MYRDETPRPPLAFRSALTEQQGLAQASVVGPLEPPMVKTHVPRRSWTLLSWGPDPPK